MVFGLEIPIVCIHLTRKYITFSRSKSGESHKKNVRPETHVIQVSENLCQSSNLSAHRGNLDKGRSVLFRLNFALFGKFFAFANGTFGGLYHFAEVGIQILPALDFTHGGDAVEPVF